MLFPFAEYWWFYGLFMLFVLGMLALDLGLFHKEAHTPTFKESLGWSVVWISLSMVFCYILYSYSLWKFPQDPRLVGLEGFDAAKLATQVAMEFLTGFVVEKSLAVDNIFIFVVVFGYFAIPLKYQHRVLFYGIIGALIFRAIFIALGSVLMQYEAIVWVFGGFLILTGIKMMFAESQAQDPANNIIIRILKKMFKITPTLHGDKFFVKENGVRMVTPLFVTLVFVEFSDIIFAIDSVPAIFALTKEPLIVFTSNVFAILGLRSLYFLLAGVVDKFHLLKYGLALVLVFVGLKMVYLNHAFGGKFPISWSLGIIGLCIGGSIALSFVFKKKPEQKAS